MKARSYFNKVLNSVLDAEVLEFVGFKKCNYNQNRLKDINFPEGVIIGGIV